MIRALLLFTLSAFVSAAEPEPLMTTSGKALLSEDFSGTGLPAQWDLHGDPGSFSVIDGALRGICKPGAHDPFVVVKLTAHDVTVRFSAKFAEAGVLYFAVDGYSEMFGGNTHLLRLVLKPGQVTLEQKRGSPESKHGQSAENAKVRGAGGKPAAPTPEQLDDPRFYRSEELATRRLKFGVGQWHDMLMEISGNDLVVQIDDQPALLGQATVADAAKSRVTFMVGARGTVLIDNVRAWENTRREAWEQTKAKLKKP